MTSMTSMTNIFVRRVVEAIIRGDSMPYRPPLPAYWIYEPGDEADTPSLRTRRAGPFRSLRLASIEAKDGETILLTSIPDGMK